MMLYIARRIFCEMNDLARDDKAMCIAPTEGVRRDEDISDQSASRLHNIAEEPVAEKFKCSKESGRKGLVVDASRHQMVGVRAPVEGDPPNFPASVPR